jgi:hypothetical protein
MIRKKRKQINLGQVIIPVGHPNPPEQHEEDAAKILACHYKTTVEFIVPIDDYKRKSADVMMLGVEWEIKSPIGTSKSTIYKQFRRASKQAKNIVIDTRYTELSYERIVTSVKLEMSKRHTIKKVILIDKSKKVVEFFK